MAYAGSCYKVYSLSLYLCEVVHLSFLDNRMATDLNLHQSFMAKATNESQRREIANRTRIWINCYNVDRSTSTQFGKPSTIKEDYIARHSKFWYRTTEFNYDIHMCGYTQLLRVMAKFHEAIYSNPDHPSGLNMVKYPNIKTLLLF